MRTSIGRIAARSLFAFAVSFGVAAAAASAQAIGDQKTGTPGALTVEIVPAYTRSIGRDEAPSSGDPTNPFVAGDYRLSGTLSWQLTARDTLSYNHNGTASDETAGRVTDLQGKYFYPGSSRDQSDALELHHVLSSQFGLYAGTYYRRRVCCPANGDTVGNQNGVLNGLLHEYHLEVDYISPQLGPGKIQVGAAVRGILAPHDVSDPYLSYINGPGGAKIGQQFHDYSRTQPGASGKVFLRVPLPPKTKASLFGTFQFGGGDWEEFAPIQYLYDIFDYGFDRQLGKNVSLRAYIDQLTQTNQGYPFVPPNEIHRVKMVVELHMTGALNPQGRKQLQDQGAAPKQKTSNQTSGQNGSAPGPG
jgi:hypothetical protein